MLEIGRLTRLELGYVGETDSRRVQIDVSEWLQRWPGAVIAVWVRKPEPDKMGYYANTEVEDGILTWVVTSGDVSQAGEGLAQIKALDPDGMGAIYKSRTVGTKIYASLEEMTSDPTAPDPMESWANKAAIYKEEAYRAKEEAIEASEEAVQSANNAAVDSKKAVEAAQTATKKAEEAKDAAEAVGPEIKDIKDDIDELFKEVDKLKDSVSLEVMDATKSGEIVTVNPVRGTTAKVVSKITGMDEEYSGANRITLRHLGGKNLIDFTYYLGGAGAVFEADGLKAVVNDNGTITLSGTDVSTDAYNDLISVNIPENERRIFPAGTYTLSPRIKIATHRPDKTWTGLGTKEGTFVIDEPFVLQRFFMSIKAGTVLKETIPIALVAGTSLPSSGFAYVGESYVAQFANKIGDGEFNWQTGELKDADGNLIETVEPFEEFPVLDGANTFMTGVGVSTVTYKVPDDSPGESSGVVEAFDPEVWGMPVLYLNGNTTGMSKDDAVTLNYVFGTREGTCTCKWQGSSSLAYMKKNYTVKFDTAFEAKEGWGKEKKYCMKANYIDHSHARNLVNAMLWGQIVKSRSTEPDVFANLVNGGAVDGFPILIVMNGEFLGLYTFNIPKDGWMMGMGSGTNECILCAGNACPANGFKEAATLEGENDLEIEYITDENNTAWAVTSVNKLISACINSNGSDLDTTIAPMLDWQSAIDYYIFTVLVDGHDMTLKNYLLVTFDGTKWYFSGYDMDCTYGLTWEGKTWLAANAAPSFASFANQHRVMELIKLHKKDALKARYAELRETVLSESNIATTFGNFIGKIPKPVYMQEAKKWPLIPNTSTNDISQIRDYYRMRVAMADKWMEQL